jgi:hypothetical protein
MIAPSRLTEEVPPESGLQSARQMVAAVLFEHQTPRARNVPRLPAWRAWLFVGWILLVAGVYCAHLVGLF